ncbi:MAG: hypothetical protein M3401_16125 [Actinomycetota bacterium]|nr:hypothetical protein [Actinomycetota bacterium]
MPRCRRYVRTGGFPRDLLDEAMHPQRLIGGRRQQRIAQQHLDGAFEARGAIADSPPA